MQEYKACVIYGDKSHNLHNCMSKPKHFPKVTPLKARALEISSAVESSKETAAHESVEEPPWQDVFDFNIRHRARSSEQIGSKDVLFAKEDSPPK